MGKEWLKDGEEDVDMSGGEEDLRGRLSLHKGFFLMFLSLYKTSNRPPLLLLQGPMYHHRQYLAQCPTNVVSSPITHDAYSHQRFNFAGSTFGIDISAQRRWNFRHRGP